MRSLVYLLVMLLLSSVPAFAGMTMIMSGGGAAVSDCPAGTYMFAYNGDHSSGTDFGCSDSGNGDEDGDIVDANVCSGGAGSCITVDADSVEIIDTAADNTYLGWTVTAGDLVDDEEGTIYWDVYFHDADLQQHSMVQVHVDGNDNIWIEIDGPSDGIDFTHEGSNDPETITNTTAIGIDTWTRVGVAWKVSTDEMSVCITTPPDGDCTGDWSDGVIDTITAFTDQPNQILIGEDDDATSGRSVSEHAEVRDLFVIDTYKGTDPGAW